MVNEIQPKENFKMLPNAPVSNNMLYKKQAIIHANYGTLLQSSGNINHMTNSL